MKNGSVLKVPCSSSQIWKRKAWPTSSAGSSESGQRDVLRGSLRLRLEDAAERLWSLANCLWLLSALESGLDLDIHSRHTARLRAQDRRTQGGPDGCYYR